MNTVAVAKSWKSSALKNYAELHRATCKKEPENPCQDNSLYFERPALEEEIGPKEQETLAGLVLETNYQFIACDQICMLAPSRVSDQAAWTTPSGPAAICV